MPGGQCIVFLLWLPGSRSERARLRSGVGAGCRTAAGQATSANSRLKVRPLAARAQTTRLIEAAAKTPRRCCHVNVMHVYFAGSTCEMLTECAMPGATCLTVSCVCLPEGFTIAKVLQVLETLDRQNFARLEVVNFIHYLYQRIFGVLESKENEVCFTLPPPPSL